MRDAEGAVKDVREKIARLSVVLLRGGAKGAPRGNVRFACGVRTRNAQRFSSPLKLASKVQKRSPP